MQKLHVVIKYLDNPIRFLHISFTDLVLYISPFFVGAFFDSMFVIPCIGFMGIFTVKRLLKGVPRFYLARFWYWSLPTKNINRAMKASLPDSSKRYWVG